MQRHATLKKLHRKIRDDLADDFNLRVHRALSWLEQGERVDEISDRDSDLDTVFIFHWIAFNAVFGQEKLEGGPLTNSDREEIYRFLKTLVRVDEEGCLYAMLWQDFSKYIRVLTDNQFLSEEFWKCQAGKIGKAELNKRTALNKKTLMSAMGDMNTPKVLSIVIRSLRLLRNQIFHGSSTFGSRVNREQLELGSQFMKRFVPLVIQVMLENPTTDWGPVKFPVINDSKLDKAKSSGRARG